MSKQYDHLDRLTSITNTPSGIGASPVLFAYAYNAANQRTAITNAGASFWQYLYDPLGQVISGKRYWPDGTPVAGQQFEYTFDDIGNRRTAGAGGDNSGNNLRVQSYSANNLNQYTSRTVPGFVEMTGTAVTNATVLVWGSETNYALAKRHDQYFWGELAYDNTAGPLWLTITNLAALPGGTNADLVANTSGNLFLPGATEHFTNDYDGNLLQDSHWDYGWDAENRLVALTNRASAAPAQVLHFDYDHQGRRIRKQVWNNADGSGDPDLDLRFVYDGWNLTAELDALHASPALTLLRSYLWGLDLSGSAQGAGGVGGLLQITYYGALTTSCFVGFDGNGNVGVLVNAADGSLTAQYEYGP